ncbi:MAG: ATP-binding cassette domain-containing protein, partial [Candidatus Gracilibacteria bacterium]|nr:ATP-binding cassette domain-containing protein [Candidatus Gracilibacteria bacterium]
MFEGVYAFVFSVFSIEILKVILKAIENNNQEKFVKFIVIYLVGTLILSGGRFLTYKWGWTGVYFDGSDYYYKKYLNIFINAEGNEVEKIGTGRFISILKNGVGDWMDMHFELGQNGLYGVLFLFYAIYTVFSINILGGFISLVLIFLGGIISYEANIYMRDKRLLRKEVEKEAEHQAVIALMSKNELMQNNGLKNFLSKIGNNYELAKQYQYPVNIGFTVVDEIPRIIFLIIRVGVYFYMSYTIYNKTASFAELTIFITIISLTEIALKNFFDIVRMILRKFASLELLWKTFENLTPIKGYDKGGIFSIKGDKIIIKDIVYGYTDKKIFNKFSLEIEGNKKTALVGVSGGGKTTLMKILAGYLRPQKGSVEIFGND